MVLYCTTPGQYENSAATLVDIVALGAILVQPVYVVVHRMLPTCHHPVATQHCFLSYMVRNLLSLVLSIAAKISWPYCSS